MARDRGTTLKVYKACMDGIQDEFKLKKSADSNTHSFKTEVWSTMMFYGLDFVFYMEKNGYYVNILEDPDSLSIGKIRSQKAADYNYDSQDLDFGKTILENRFAKNTINVFAKIQIIYSKYNSGTISGKIKLNLPPIINTNIGTQQLAGYIHYSKEQMKLIDWANYHIASKSFSSTALSRAHACKSFNNQWYAYA